MLRQHIASRNTDPCKSATAVGKLQHTPKHDFTSFRLYRGATFTFEREFDGKWGLNASYTLSELKGNIEGGIRSDNGQTDSGLTTAFDLPALTTGSFGLLPNNRTHNIKVFGSYAPTKWLTLGANASFSSPRSFGCFGRAPANADANLAGRFYGASAFYCNLDGQGNVVSNPVGFTVVNSTNPAIPSTLQLVPRGSRFKSDWLAQVNLDAQVKLPTDTFNSFIRVSVTNVFNIRSKLDFQENGTTNGGAPLATYGLPNTYQAPRSVRIQLGVGF